MPPPHDTKMTVQQLNEATSQRPGGYDEPA